MLLIARDNALNILKPLFPKNLLSLGVKGLKDNEMFKTKTKNWDALYVL